MCDIHSLCRQGQGPPRARASQGGRQGHAAGHEDGHFVFGFAGGADCHAGRGIDQDPDRQPLDGFIFLDNENKKGLGAYLYESLNNMLPIIGAAKSKFYNNTKNTIELVRGQSKNPIYISAIGIELDEAAKLINNMYGEFRLPNLIKQVDTETRN